MSKLSFKATLILLGIITLLSFWLRVYGIQFGLPFEYHPDEHQYIFPAIGVVSGNFQPRAHYNPAFYPYLIGVVYTLVYWGLTLFNAFPDFFNLDSAWSEQMQPWTTGMIYLARYVSVAVGVLTTLMVYRLGRRAYSRETGVGAAIIFGLTFLPAREAHFAVSDAPVALGVVITLYLCLKIVERAGWSDYLGVGVALGLSAATKYSAGLLILPIGAAHLLSRRYADWPKRLVNIWRLLITGLASIIAYLLVSPYTLLEYDKFWANFSENLNSSRVGFQGLNLDPAGGAVFYSKSLIWGFGWPLFVLFLSAVVFALWRHRRVDIFLLTFPVLGLLYMQRQEMYFARWLMPFLPPMAVLASETLHSGINTLTRFNQTPRLQKFILHPSSFILLITILTLPSTYAAYHAARIFSLPDTRSQALAWIRENVPAGSNVAAELLGPPWGPPLAMPGLPVSYTFAPVPDGGVAEIDIQQYHEWGVQYIVASSYHYARPLVDQSRQAQLAKRMQMLDNQAELMAEFQPYESSYSGFFYHDQVFGPADDVLYRTQPGPVIKVYRLE